MTEPIWPEKITPKNWNNIDKRNYGTGYNAAIDACKLAWEKAGQVSPHLLYKMANGDSEKYKELLLAHGYIIPKQTFGGKGVTRFPENNQVLCHACAKQVEEAKGEGLVELDVDKIWEEFEQFLEPHTCDLMIKPQYARNANLIQNWFKRICEKYGTPKPRPAVTKENLTLKN